VKKQQQQKKTIKRNKKSMPLKSKSSWEPVAHVCNPNYTRSRDQENLGSGPAGANSLQDPILKKSIIKNG
jgi:hypothetical protein